jgi:hypothetical protein
MGHRANFVIVQDGRRSLYYSRWAAVTIPQSLFFGPELAIRYVERLEPTDALLDEVWCEGAAIIARDDHRLLFFVGDIRYTPELRRDFLPLLGHNWPGWEIHWAHQGIVDVALYLGIDPAAVRDQDRADHRLEKAELRAPPRFILSVITIGRAGGARDYGFEDGLTSILAVGPGLLDRLAGRDEAPAREDEELEGGAFINQSCRKIWVWWSGHEDDRWVGWIAGHWPD